MATSSSWRVRVACDDDIESIHAMICELAAYEREPDAVEATPDDLRRALFADTPLLNGFVAELAGAGQERVIGMALWFTSYSTWRGRHGIWLEDLFVRPAARGLGVGRALLAALAAEAVRRDHGRLEWSVLDWNAPALGFYRTLGARPLTDWTTHRISGPELVALAGRAPEPAAE
jgi:GNAT superfamily N-acetyltransferase